MLINRGASNWSAKTDGGRNVRSGLKSDQCRFSEETEELSFLTR
jgi:hypothetical protein